MKEGTPHRHHSPHHACELHFSMYAPTNNAGQEDKLPAPALEYHKETLRLKLCGFFNNLEGFNIIAHFNVVISVDADTALIAF